MVYGPGFRVQGIERRRWLPAALIISVNSGFFKTGTLNPT